MKHDAPDRKPPERSAEDELRAVEAFLRAHDPARAVGGGFSAEREKRVLRYMEHPLLATIYLHHRAAACAGAALALALVLAVLFALRAGDWRLFPVSLRAAPPAAAPAPPPPEDDPGTPLSEGFAEPPPDLPLPDVPADPLPEEPAPADPAP